MGIIQSIVKHTLKGLHAAKGAKGHTRMSDDDAQRLMQRSTTIARGFQFALELPESADAHYAGKGVKRDAKERPIFWYKPQGAGKYRVIFADLSVKDEDHAPQVPGAKRLKKASKSTNPAVK